MGGASQSNEVWRLDMAELTWQKVPTPGPTPGGQWRMAPGVADTACKFAYLFSGEPNNLPRDLWAFDMSTTGLSEDGQDRPGLFLSVSPNPAKGQVKIIFTLPDEEPYSLRLYDAAGRIVRVIDDSPERKGPGLPGGISWSPDVPRGVYFLRLEAGGRVLTEKLVVN